MVKKDLPQFAIQLPVVPATLPFAVLRAGCAQQGVKRSSEALRVARDELVQPLGFCNQCITPLLGSMHDGGFGPVTIVILAESRFDACRVNAAHELSDILQLSPATFMGRDAPCECNGITQIFGQLQRGQPACRKFDQTFTQGLQGMHVPLALGLARRRVIGVLLGSRRVRWGRNRAVHVVAMIGRFVSRPSIHV